MFRFALPFLAVALCAVQSASAVDVVREVATIQTNFSDSVKEISSLTEAAAKRAAYEKAMADRNAALAKLAATAEAEKSTEHAALTRLYQQLNQREDAIRHARAMMADGAKDATTYSLFIQTLAGGDEFDDAAAALRELLKLDLDEKTAGTYLTTTPGAVFSVYRSLAAAERLDEAESVLNDWQTKLDAFKSEDAALQKSVENAQRMQRSMRQQLASTKARAALIGQQYFPLEEPTWLNGAAISPGDLRGKVVLLDFWAVWCGPCIATFPHLIELHDKYADKGLVIVGVTKRYKFDWDAEAKRGKSIEDLEPAKEDAATTEFAKHHGLKHRLAIMADDAASRKYGVSGIPQVVVIDQGGVIRLIKVGSGEKNAHAIEAEIRKLLGLETAAVSK